MASIEKCVPDIALKLPVIDSNTKIVDCKGEPTKEFIEYMTTLDEIVADVVESIEYDSPDAALKVPVVDCIERVPVDCNVEDVRVHYDPFTENTVIYRDEKEFGSRHEYSKGEQFIRFQKGPSKDKDSIPGFLDEDLIKICIDRLTSFVEEGTPYTSAGSFERKITLGDTCNREAIVYLELAFKALSKRRCDRYVRGVLGTSEN